MTTLQSYHQHRFENNLQSVVLILGMLAVLSVLGYMLGGPQWLAAFAVFAAITLALAPRLGPLVLFRFYKARPISPGNAPGLYQIAAELSRRAGLETVPALYYIPSRIHNAFAIGSGKSASIAMTHALLEDFSGRELAGIVAHEISHIRNQDTVVMGLADSISRFSTFLSRLGLLLVIVNIPLVMAGQSGGISWTALLIMVLLPTLANLMQLGLSRTREFAADADAAHLTGDPDGLAIALVKLEKIQGGAWERILLPGRRLPEPSLLRTHPPTEERIRRLMELKNNEKTGLVFEDLLKIPVEAANLLGTLFQKKTPQIGKPVWHLFGGTWY